MRQDGGVSADVARRGRQGREAKAAGRKGLCACKALGHPLPRLEDVGRLPRRQGRRAGRLAFALEPDSPHSRS
jgi:hypothetical protein